MTLAGALSRRRRAEASWRWPPSKQKLADELAEAGDANIFLYRWSEADHQAPATEGIPNDVGSAEWAATIARQ